MMGKRSAAQSQQWNAGQQHQMPMAYGQQPGMLPQYDKQPGMVNDSGMAPPMTPQAKQPGFVQDSGMAPQMPGLTPIAQAQGWQNNHPHWENMMQQRAAGGHPMFSLLTRMMNGGR